MVCTVGYVFPAPAGLVSRGLALWGQPSTYSHLDVGALCVYSWRQMEGTRPTTKPERAAMNDVERRNRIAELEDLLATFRGRIRFAQRMLDSGVMSSEQYEHELRLNTPRFNLFNRVQRLEAELAELTA